MVSIKSPSGAQLSVVEYIDQAQLLLDAAVRRTFSKKEEIYPLQTAEMESIKARAKPVEAVPEAPAAKGKPVVDQAATQAAAPETATAG